MKNLSKHFTAITEQKHITRPILKGIHYNAADNSMTVTDSHRLLQVKIGIVPVTYTQDPTTLEFIEGEYPKVDHLIPQINEHITIRRDKGLPRVIPFHFRNSHPGSHNR